MEKQIDAGSEAAEKAMPETDLLTAEIDGRKWAYSLNDDGTVMIIRSDSNVSGELIVPGEINGSKVTEIGFMSLAGYGSITSIKIPDGVKKICTAAFWNCSSLKEVTIPASVNTIGFMAFNGCNSLATIKVASGDAERITQMLKVASILIKRVKVEKALLDEVAKNATEKGNKIAEDDKSVTTVRALSAEETERTSQMFERQYKNQEATYKRMNEYLDAMIGDEDANIESGAASEEKKQGNADDCGEGFTWVYQATSSIDISRLTFVDG